MSRIFLYYNELGFEGSLKQGDLGASLSTAIMVLRMLGICPESMLAYDDNTDGKNIFDKRPSALCYRAAKGTKDTDPKTIHASIAVGQSDTVQNIKQALDNGYYVPFGFMVFQEFESDAVASNGIVPMPNVNSQSVGGHAVYAVGYDEATKRFKVANSWGTSWGDKGFFYLPYEYFTQQSADGSGPLVSEIYQIDHASNATVLLTSPKELLTEYTHITKLAGLAQKYNADMNEVYKIRSILQEMLTLAEFVHKVIDDASEIESFATSTIHKAEDIAHKIGDEIRKIT